MPESTHDVAPARSPRTAVGVQAFLAESVAVADGRLFVQGAGWAHLQVPKLPVHPGRLGIGLPVWPPRAPGGPAPRAGVRIGVLRGPARGGVAARPRSAFGPGARWGEPVPLAEP